MIRNIAFTVSSLALCATLTGCVHADGPYSRPLQQKLRLQSEAPQTYAVQVADGVAVPVSADGRVVVEIPRLQRCRTAYLFGIVKVREDFPEDAVALVVKKEGRIVKKLSLNELKALPTDDEGYKLLKVE